MKQYLKKVIVIYSLVLGLLEAPAPIVAPFLAAFISGSIFADSDEANTHVAPYTTTDSLDSMLGYYRSLAVKNNPKHLIDGQGQGVLEDTKSFIEDPSNAAALASDDGKELLAYHNKFLNYFETKGKLEKCMEEIADGFLWGGKEKVARYGRDLDQRVLGGILETDVSGFNCHTGIANKTNLDDLYNATMKATKGIKLSSLENTIFKNSFKKVTKAWLKTKYSYDKDFAPGNSLTDDEKEEMRSSLCEGGVCSDVQKEIMDEVTPDFMNLLSGSELQRFSSEEAGEDISAKIVKLNELTSTLTMDAKKSIWRFGAHTLDTEGDGTKTAINQYQNTYLELSSTGAGSLMWTEAMQNASGAMKDLKDWDWTGNDNDIRITPHKEKVSKEVMDDAIAEVLGRVSEQAKEINNLESKRHKDIEATEKSRRAMSAVKFTNRREGSLKEYMEMSPSVVGQSLAAHPENVQGVCNAIDSIIREERNSVWLDNGMMVVTVAAGIGLVATGLGAGAGASLLTLAVAGLAVGTVDTGYTFVRMKQEKQEYQSFLNTYYGGLGDDYTLVEAKEALENFESAEMNFYYAVGFTVLDALTLGISRVGRNLKPDQLRKMTDFYNAITDNKVGRGLAKLMKGFSTAKKEAYRFILEKIALSNTSGIILKLLNKMSFGNLEFLLDKFYGFKNLCKGATCSALDEGIEALAQRNTHNLTKSEIDELTGPIFAKHTNNKPALDDAVTSGQKVGAFGDVNLSGITPPTGDLRSSRSLTNPNGPPAFPEAPKNFDAPVVRNTDDSATRALALRQAEISRASKAVEKARKANAIEKAGRGTISEAEAASRANALRIAKEQEALKVAEELAEARKLAKAIEAEKVKAGVTESERFSRAIRIADANAELAEKARLAKAIEAARLAEMASEGMTEAEKFSRAARIAKLNDEARGAAKVAKEAARAAEEAKATATLVETERFKRIGRIQDENIRIINQVKAAKEADAARVAADLAEAKKLATARNSKNAVAEKEIRGLPRDRSVVVAKNRLPVPVEDTKDVKRALDGEILEPEIATKRPVAGAIESDPIELTARDVTPTPAPRAIEGPKPGAALVLKAAKDTPTKVKSVGRKVANFFRDTVARLLPSAGRFITHEEKPGDSAVVVAPEEKDTSDESGLEEDTSETVKPETTTTKPKTDPETGEVSCEEGEELVDVEGEDKKVCEKISCEEGYELNDEKDKCNIICEEGLVANAEKTACGTQGFLPQGVNMIRRGIRKLGGLW